MRSIKNISKYTINYNEPITQALSILNETDVGIALIINDLGVLLGTLTDGDIRRGLLKGFDLNDAVNNVMKTDFTFASINDDIKSIKSKFSESYKHQIPVLDGEGKLIELLIDIDNSKASIDNPVVIMAGGFGQRLRPYTISCPKPMLKLGEKPILQIVLEEFRQYGFKKFYISVNYLKEQIMDFFEDGNSFDVSIKYLIEDKPLGTAGSLSLLHGKINESFIVANGDILTRFNPMDLLNFHSNQDSIATLCVREYQVSVPFGVVETKGVELLKLLEKPSYSYMVNAGIYAFKPSILNLIKKNMKIDMPDLLIHAKEKGNKISTCPIHEFWIDIGRPESLKEAIYSWNKF